MVNAKSFNFSYNTEKMERLKERYSIFKSLSEAINNAIDNTYPLDSDSHKEIARDITRLNKEREKINNLIKDREAMLWGLNNKPKERGSNE